MQIHSVLWVRSQKTKAIKSEEEVVFYFIPSDGTWSTWSLWSPCSTSCYPSHSTRTRACGQETFGGVNHCQNEPQSGSETRLCPEITHLCEPGAVIQKVSVVLVIVVRWRIAISFLHLEYWIIFLTTRYDWFLSRF